MSFLSDLFGGGNDDAAEDAARIQADATREGIALTRETRDLARSDLAPFRGLGERALAPLEQILDPTGQVDFLIDNPLFEAALQRFNQNTNASAAASGRFRAGDTRDELFSNFLRAGIPLLDFQRQGLFQAVNTGQASAAGQAATSERSNLAITDLLNQGANALAAGEVGAAQARQERAGNIVEGAAVAALIFSDRRLKHEIAFHSMHGPYRAYTFRYKGSDTVYRGVMADEVGQINPDAVTYVDGFAAVDYARL